MRSGLDNKCCLKSFNFGKTSPQSIKYANQQNFCSMLGNSISAWGKIHEACPENNIIV